MDMNLEVYKWVKMNEGHEGKNVNQEKKAQNKYCTDNAPGRKNRNHNSENDRELVMQLSEAKRSKRRILRYPEINDSRNWLPLSGQKGRGP